MLKKELLDILGCPICKSSLREEENFLICEKCKKKYPIKDGIPVLLIEEAQPLENKSKKQEGFTLIELLIVVAIIAILAAIAMPNFLSAQVRAKVSRAKADMHSIATALEAYAVDNNTYPPNDWLTYKSKGLNPLSAYNVIPIQLTTPIAYLSDGRLKDPFATSPQISNANANAEDASLYTYYHIKNINEVLSYPPSDQAIVLIYFRGLWVDGPGYNEGALEKYGKWTLLSLGPDQKLPSDNNPPTYGVFISYDPTNGTTSSGNIIFSQKGFKETE